MKQNHININNRRAAFTLVEILIIVAIFALLAAVAIPEWTRSRDRTRAVQTVVNELGAHPKQVVIKSVTEGAITVDFNSAKDTTAHTAVVDRKTMKTVKLDGKPYPTELPPQPFATTTVQ